MFKFEITANSVAELKTKVAELADWLGVKDIINNHIGSDSSGNAVTDGRVMPPNAYASTANAGNYPVPSAPNTPPYHPVDYASPAGYHDPNYIHQSSVAAQPQPHNAAVPPSPPQASVPIAPAPTYTHEQIMQAGTALVDAGKMPQLMDLLTRFGVQAVTQLQSDQLAAFAIELRKLGASI